MSDRIILEKAAKVAGLSGVEWREEAGAMGVPGRYTWRPLSNRHGAMELARVLKLTVDFESGSVWGPGGDEMTQLAVADHAHTNGFCRAIVEAAAKLHDIYEARARAAAQCEKHPELARMWPSPQPDRVMARKDGGQ